MLITVQGYVPGGTAYRAVLDDSRPGAVGCATGPDPMLDVLRPWQGAPVRLFPTGPTVTVDLGRPDHALAVLRAATNVRIVEGELRDPSPPGVIA
jgi:hypothetical protein